MTKSMFTFAVMGIMAGAMVTGCMDSSGKKVEDAKEKVNAAAKELQAARARYSEEWQKFKSESEHKISVNAKSIDGFRAKMERSGSRFKAAYSEKVAGLEERNRDLEEKIEDYKDRGEDTWEAFKNGFNRDMDTLERALKDLAADNG